jgi:hypothetical protein
MPATTGKNAHKEHAMHRSAWLILLFLLVGWALAPMAAFAAQAPPPPAASPGQAVPAAPADAAATPAPTTVTNVTNVTIPPGPSPQSFATDFAEGVTILALGAADGLLAGIVHAISGGPNDFVTQTPPPMTYANGQVVALWGKARLAADALLALLVALGGLLIALRQQGGRLYLGPAALLQRAVIAAVLLNASLFLGQWAIDLTNGLAGAVGGALPPWDMPVPPGADVGALLGRFAYLVASLFLLAFMAVRILLVDVTLVTAPLALVACVIPLTQGIFARWLSVFAGYLVIQVPMVLTLAIGQGVLGVAGGGPAAIVLGIAAFVAVFKLPGVFGIGSHASGTGVAGALLLVQGVERVGSYAAGLATAGSSAATVAAARGVGAARALGARRP